MVASNHSDLWHPAEPVVLVWTEGVCAPQGIESDGRVTPSPSNPLQLLTVVGVHTVSFTAIRNDDSLVCVGLKREEEGRGRKGVGGKGEGVEGGVRGRREGRGEGEWEEGGGGRGRGEGGK